MSDKRVTASIGDGRTIEFESPEDALVFAASTGYANFVLTWQQIYPGKGNPGQRDFSKYLIEGKTRLRGILTNTHLSDGQTLAQALKKEKLRQ